MWSQKEPQLVKSLQSKQICRQGKIRWCIQLFMNFVLVCHNVICTYWSRISGGLAAQPFPLFRWWTKCTEWQVWSTFVYIFSPDPFFVNYHCYTTTTIGLNVKRTLTDKLCTKIPTVIIWWHILSSYYALECDQCMYYSVLNEYLHVASMIQPMYYFYG